MRAQVIPNRYGEGDRLYQHGEAIYHLPPVHLIEVDRDGDLLSGQ